GAPAGDDPYGGKSLLVGSVYPDGHTTWISVPGYLDDAERVASDRVEFFAGGALIGEEQAALYRQPEGEIINVVVPLPADFDAVTEFKHVGERTQVHAVGVVDRHDRSRSFKAR